MATPFELLEAFVTISERGASDVEASLKRIEKLAAEVTSKPVEVAVTSTANASDAASAIAISLSAATAAATTIEESIVSMGTALQVVATPAINDFRGALVPVENLIGDVEDAVFELKSSATVIPQITSSVGQLAVNTSTASGALVVMANQSQRLSILQRVQAWLASWAGYIGNAAGAVTRFVANVEVADSGMLRMIRSLALLKLGIDGFNEASSRQKSFIAFDAILGDGEQARKILEDINAISIDTPFPVAEIRQTVQQLLALGSAQEDVLAEFAMLANVAAGVNAPIEQIARAYTQVRSKQRLYAEELQQLGDAGVPILQELAEMLGVTTGEVRKLGETGELGFPELDAAFRRMTGEGGKFNNIIQETAFIGTSGLVKVKDAAAQLVAELGGISGLKLQDEFRGLVELLNAVGEGAKSVAAGRSALERGIGSTIEDEGFRFQTLFGALGEALAFEEEMTRLSENMARPLAGTTKQVEALSQRWAPLRAEIKQTELTMKEFNSGISPIEQMLKSLSDPDIDAAESLRKSLLTPVEELKEKLTEVRFLFAKGLITEDTFTSAIDKAVKDTDKLLEKSQEFRRSLVTTGFNVGSTQAFTFKLESDLPREQIRKTEEQLQAQKIGNDFLKEIAEKIDDIKINPDPTPELFESELF